MNIHSVFVCVCAKKSILEEHCPRFLYLGGVLSPRSPDLLLRALVVTRLMIVVVVRFLFSRTTTTHRSTNSRDPAHSS